MSDPVLFCRDFHSTSAVLCLRIISLIDAQASLSYGAGGGAHMQAATDSASALAEAKRLNSADRGVRVTRSHG
jgi:hypothetical protein